MIAGLEVSVINLKSWWGMIVMVAVVLSDGYLYFAKCHGEASGRWACLRQETLLVCAVSLGAFIAGVICNVSVVVRQRRSSKTERDAT